jgi:hypothetical protein
MTLKSLILGSLLSTALVGQAHALTYDILPSNGVFAPGSFSVQVNGLTGDTNAIVLMSITPNFSCTLTSIFTPPSVCASQVVTGGINKPTGWFGPFNNSGAGPGILANNDNFGSQAGESNVDGFNFTLSPSNNILTFAYAGLSSAASVASVLFQLSITTGTPVALVGQIVNQPGGDAVPIPAALPLLAAGLGGLGVASRKAMKTRA